MFFFVLHLICTNILVLSFRLFDNILFVYSFTTYQAFCLECLSFCHISEQDYMQVINDKSAKIQILKSLTFFTFYFIYFCFCSLHANLIYLLFSVGDKGFIASIYHWYSLLQTTYNDVVTCVILSLSSQEQRAVNQKTRFMPKWSTRAFTYNFEPINRCIKVYEGPVATSKSKK